MPARQYPDEKRIPMNRQQLETSIIQQVTPSAKQQQKMKQIVNTLLTRITTELKQLNCPAIPKLVGSIAKDTYLCHSLDIDIFLVFPQKTKRQTLEEITSSIGKKILQNTESRYAEHPYIRGFFDQNIVELVPCYHITSAEEKQSAVDRTPLHTAYIRKNLMKQQKPQVRLLKQFLKGIGCYGAEAEIQGFSGYLCELLILKFGDFKTLLQNAKYWEQRIHLSIDEGHYPRFSTPLTFIDPVDPTRNVASAVSTHTFQLFIQACNSYLNQPKNTFFFPNPIKPLPLKKIAFTLQKTNRRFIGMSFFKPNIIDENLIPQLRKSLRSIVQECKHHDFVILNHWFKINDNEQKVYLVFEPESLELTANIQHMGPPISQSEHVEEFKEKWNNHPFTINKPYIENNRWYVTIQREYTTVKALLSSKVQTLSLGKDISEMIQNDFKVHNQDELLIPELQELWTKILDPRYPWEW